MLHIAHNPDDGQIREIILVAAEPEPLTERVFAPPESTGHGLVDEDDAGGLLDIGVAERAPLQQRYLHRREILRGDQAELCERLAARRPRLVPLDHEDAVNVRIAQGQVIYGPGVAHAGQGLDPLRDLSEEGGLLRPRLVFGCGQVDPHRQRVARVEARLYALQAEEAADHQPRSDRQG